MDGSRGRSGRSGPQNGGPAWNIPTVPRPHGPRISSSGSFTGGPSVGKDSGDGPFATSSASQGYCPAFSRGRSGSMDHPTNIYHRRLAMEKLSLARRNFDETVLSTNPKTGCSLNFPVSNCRPTSACMHACYGCKGPISFPYAIDKSMAIDRWIREDPEWTARKVHVECRGRRIRLSGSGDMVPEYFPFLAKMRDLGIPMYRNCLRGMAKG